MPAVAVQILPENHLLVCRRQAVVRAIPDNRFARQPALRVFHLRIAGQRDRFVGHAVLHVVIINRLVAGRVDWSGLCRPSKSITTLVSATMLVDVPARLRQIGDQLLAGQFHLRIVHVHMAAINRLARRSGRNPRGPNSMQRRARAAVCGGRVCVTMQDFVRGVRRSSARAASSRDQQSRQCRPNIFTIQFFFSGPVSITVWTWLEMVRKESLCRHKKPSPSTWNFPSPVLQPANAPANSPCRSACHKRIPAP